MAFIPGVRILLSILILVSPVVSAKTLVSGEFRPVMLEVYTSQGCSSCPPAEVWMKRFKDDPRLWQQLVPINFHVDYWDYLGWPDPYADSAFSARQRQYRSLGHTPNVATPGFVVDGKGWNGWFYHRDLPMARKPSEGRIEATLNGGRVAVNYKPAKALAQPLQISVAILGFDQKTPVPRGENHGRTLHHDFVVLGHFQKTLQPVLSATSKLYQLRESPLPRITGFQSERQAVVVWVNKRSDPSPLAVVADWL